MAGRPKIGQKVRVFAIAEADYDAAGIRKWKSISTNEHVRLHSRRWVSKKDGNYGMKKIELPYVEGYYMGYRHVQEGVYDKGSVGGTSWEGSYYDTPPHLHITGVVEVWLVVLSEREDPIKAFPKDCKILEDTENNRRISDAN